MLKTLGCVTHLPRLSKDSRHSENRNFFKLHVFGLHFIVEENLKCARL